MAGHVLGWLLHGEDRARLLALFPPRYRQVMAHHVTLQAGAPRGMALPREHEGFVLGRADDGAGVEALVVEIGGTTDRPGGSTYHVTWSLAPGRKPVESNAVIREHGWVPFPGRHRLRLEPARFG